MLKTRKLVQVLKALLVNQHEEISSVIFMTFFKLFSDLFSIGVATGVERLCFRLEES
jgi:hypothetical protein